MPWAKGVPRDRSEAAKWFRKAAEQGGASAQYFLGRACWSGDGVPQDQAEAMKWFRLAAAQDLPEAQVRLGLAYERGLGSPKDTVEAARWYRMAAERGNADAQCALGWMYCDGRGVAKDEIEALAWMNIAAASGDENNVKSREALERDLGRQISLVAQQRSKELIKEIDAAKSHRSAALNGSPIANEQAAPKASGSGAIVSANGLILTAAHVVADAAHVRVVTAQGTCEAQIVRVDQANDLAVLKIEGRALVALPIKSSRQVRLGQSVATIGFPNISFQGFSPKVTRGEISSVNGFADDPRSWQISVPVQPGNSGGPLLDEYGNLIGIVVSKLGLKTAVTTGDLPQNVNYAVKSAYALALLEPYLDANAPEPKSTGQRLNFEDVVATAQQSVVLILVY